MEQNILSISLKDYKKQINDLIATLASLEKGSKEYMDTANKIREKQNALNDAMKVGKQAMNDVKNSNEAATGSYNALSQEMSKLKKEWKETNDEAKRNELGKQIDTINSKLKDMDASIGNYSRSVGNYAIAGKALKTELKDLQNQMSAMLAQGVDPSSKAFQDLAKRAGQVKDAMSDAKAVVKQYANDTMVLSDMLDLAKTGTAVFGAWTGAMSAFGVENEECQKAMQKLQGIMLVINSLSTIQTALVDKSSASHRILAGIFKFITGERTAEVVSITSENGMLDTNTQATNTNTLAKVKNREELVADAIQEKYYQIQLQLEEAQTNKNTEAIKRYTNQLVLMKLQYGKVVSLPKINDFTAAKKWNEGATGVGEMANAGEKASGAFSKLGKAFSGCLKALGWIGIAITAIQLFKQGAEWVVDLWKGMDELNENFKENNKQLETNKQKYEGVNQNAQQYLSTLEKIEQIKVDFGFADNIAKSDIMLKNSKDALNDYLRTLEDCQADVEQAYHLLFLHDQRNSMANVDGAYESLRHDLKGFMDMLQGASEMTEEELVKALGDATRKLDSIKWAVKETKGGFDDLEESEKGCATAMNTFAEQCDIGIERLFGLASALRDVQTANKEWNDFLVDLDIDATSDAYDKARKNADKQYQERMKVIQQREAELAKNGGGLPSEIADIEKAKKDAEKARELALQSARKTGKKTKGTDDKYDKRAKEVNDEIEALKRKNKLEEDNIKFQNELAEAKDKVTEADKHNNEEKYVQKQIADLELLKAKYEEYSKDKTLGDKNMAQYAKNAADTELQIIALKNGIIVDDAKEVTRVLKDEYDKRMDAARGAMEAELANATANFSMERIKGQSTEKSYGQELLGETKDTSTLKAIELAEKENETLFKIKSEGLQRQLELEQQRLAMLTEGTESYLELQKEIANTEMQLEQEKTEYLLEQADIRINKKNEETKLNKKSTEQQVKAYTDMAKSIGSLMGSISDIMEENIEQKVANGEISEEQAKEEFERVKKVQLAELWINTLAGAAGAFLNDMKTYPAPANYILAGIDFATAMAAGIAQTKAIQNQQYGGSTGGSTGSGISMASVSPLLNENIDSQSMTALNTEAMAEAQGDSKVYILQSDIEKSNNQVKVRQSNTTF